MYWNLPVANANYGRMQMAPIANPINQTRKGLNLTNLVQNSFSPSNRFSFGENNAETLNVKSQDSDISQNEIPNRIGKGVIKIQSNHAHLRNLFRGNKLVYEEVEAIGNHRPTANFMSSEVQEIIEKIQKAQEDVEKNVKVKNSMNQKAKEAEENHENQPHFRIESIPEDKEEHLQTSEENDEKEEKINYSKTDGSQDTQKNKIPNVFSSFKQNIKSSGIENDHEKMVLENSNLFESIKLSENDGFPVVNIYSERNLHSNRFNVNETNKNEEIKLSERVKKGIELKSVVNYEDIGIDMDTEIRQIYQNDSSYQRIKNEPSEIKEKSDYIENQTPSNIFQEIKDCSPIVGNNKLHFLDTPKVSDKKFTNRVEVLSSDEKRRMLYERKELIAEIKVMEKEISELEAFKAQSKQLLEKYNQNDFKIQTPPKKSGKVVKIPRSPPPIPVEKPTIEKPIENPQSDSVFSGSKNYTSIYSQRKDLHHSPEKFLSPTKSSLGKIKGKISENIFVKEKIREEDHSQLLKVMTAVEKELLNSIQKKKKIK